MTFATILVVLVALSGLIGTMLAYRLASRNHDATPDLIGDRPRGRTSIDDIFPAGVPVIHVTPDPLGPSDPSVEVRRRLGAARERSDQMLAAADQDAAASVEASRLHERAAQAAAGAQQRYLELEAELDRAKQTKQRPTWDASAEAGEFNAETRRRIDEAQRAVTRASTARERSKQQASMLDAASKRAAFTARESGRHAEDARQVVLALEAELKACELTEPTDQIRDPPPCSSTGLWIGWGRFAGGCSVVVGRGSVEMQWAPLGLASGVRTTDCWLQVAAESLRLGPAIGGSAGVVVGVARADHGAELPRLIHDELRKPVRRGAIGPWMFGTRTNGAAGLDLLASLARRNVMANTLTARGLDELAASLRDQVEDLSSTAAPAVKLWMQGSGLELGVWNCATITMAVNRYNSCGCVPPGYFRRNGH